MRSALLLVYLLLLAPPAKAEVVFQPVLGEFEFDAFSVSCPSQPAGCFTCVNDARTSGDQRLMVALGATFPNNPTTGLAEGVLRLSLPFITSA